MTTIRPRWHPPRNVRSVITTRQTGNLATHVGSADAAIGHRQRLVKAESIPQDPLWLEQVHGSDIYVAGEGPVPSSPPVADAAYTTQFNRPLAVLVADCLPVLLASPDEVAVVHAGWRGLAKGIIGRTLARFRNREVEAFLGPAIGPCHYEVDGAVTSAFEGLAGFSRGRDDEHFMMDLWAIARLQLARAGVKDVAGGGVCTWCDPQFFSHRQDRVEARFAAVIWRDGSSF